MDNSYNTHDLISRQAAIDAVIEWYGCEPSDLDYFKKIVEKLPTTDAVPVVQCKDCKYYKSWEGTILSYCSYHNNAQYVRRAEDYCSRGERKDDG